MGKAMSAPPQLWTQLRRAVGLTATSRRARCERHTNRFRPEVEILEDRILPSGFVLPTGYVIPQTPAAMAVGDFNKDGSTDIAILEQSKTGPSRVGIFLGTGDGEFTAGATYDLAGTPLAIATADFNRDGSLDLAVAQTNGTVSIFLGLGDGTFRPAQVPTTTVGGTPDALAVADFNNDGTPDLAVASATSNTVSILLGNGDGSFRFAPAVDVGSPQVAVAAGKFTASGNIDLVTADAGSDSVTVFPGQGNGTFGSGTSYVVAGTPVSLAVGDFGGDSQADIAVAHSPDGSGNNVSVLVNITPANGTTPVFQTPAVLYSPGETLVGLVAGNFEATPTGGLPTELAVASVSSGGTGAIIPLLRGGGGLKVGSSSDVSSGTQPIALAEGDFNGDGAQDIAVALNDNSVEILFGPGSDPSGFHPFNATAGADLPSTPFLADVTGDGTPDTVVVSRAGDIFVRPGIAGEPGIFAPPILVNPGQPARAVTPFHLLQAGKSVTWLAAVSEITLTTDRITIYSLNQAGKVTVQSSFDVSTNTNSPLLLTRIAAARLFPDTTINGVSTPVGFDDLVVLDAFNGHVIAFQSNGAGGFFGQVAQQISVGEANGGAAQLAIADVDGDGLPDVVVTNKLTGDAIAFLNNGGGGFTPTTVSGLQQPAGMAVGNFDGASPNEVIVANTGAFDATHPGSFDLLMPALSDIGRFPLLFTPSVGTAGMFVTGTTTDEVALLDRASGQIDVFESDGMGGFLAPDVTPLPAGIVATGLSAADVEGDGKTDDLLVGTAFGDVLVLVGQGKGFFTPVRVPGNAVPFVTGDFTGNGVPDVVVANQGADLVETLLRQPGTTNFNPGGFSSTNNVLAPGNVVMTTVAGVPYLVVANTGGNDVLVYKGFIDPVTGQSNGQFGPPTSFAVGTAPVGLTVADLNGDGIPDLVVADSGSRDVSILFGQVSGGTWGLVPGPRYQTGNGPIATQLRDVNGDGIPDLVVTNAQDGTITTLLGRGSNGIGTGFFGSGGPSLNLGVPIVQAPDANGFFADAGAVLQLNFANFTAATVFATAAGVAVTSLEQTSAAGIEVLVVGESNGDVAVLAANAAGRFNEAELFTDPRLSDPSALQVVSDQGQNEIYVTSRGDSIPIVFQLDTTGLLVAARGPLPGTVLQAANLAELESSSAALVPVLPEGGAGDDSRDFLVGDLLNVLIFAIGNTAGNGGSDIGPRTSMELSWTGLYSGPVQTMLQGLQQAVIEPINMAGAAAIGALGVKDSTVVPTDWLGNVARDLARLSLSTSSDLTRTLFQSLIRQALPASTAGMDGPELAPAPFELPLAPESEESSSFSERGEALLVTVEAT
jgi:hypothetical protein